MKNLSKRIATIAATMALVVVLGVALAACGSASALSYEEYQKNLKDAGYTAMMETNVAEEIEAFFGSDDEEKGAAEEAGISVSDIKFAMVYMSEDGDMVQIIGLKNESAAKKVKNYYEEQSKSEDDEDDEDSEDRPEMTLKRVGSVVIMGTEAGIKAAEGK